MGIRGLTTFIQNRSNLYMENFELHDTNLVIDGNAVSCQLYKWHTGSLDCFGGDYDKFGKAVNDFFDLLAECNITPYLILDGGYETRKVNTVINRMKSKIQTAKQLNPVTETSMSVFPLLIQKAFRDILHQRGIKHVRCDFEGDTETANIAKALNCPVLSYDSDYFIFDILYIPFTTFEMSVKRGKVDKTNKVYKYISCKVYRVEKFLKSFEGLQKQSLPILAVLLGNDYVKRGVFTMFYRNLKIQKCHGNQSDQQKRIKSLLIWLQNETTESALQKVLIRYKKAKRNIIIHKIQEAIKGYNCYESIYLKYLGIDLQIDKKNEIKIDFEKVNTCNENDEKSESENEDDQEEESSAEEEEICNNENQPTELDIPFKFKEKFRLSIYPANFMDILIQNKYYCIPQVENNTVEHSHKISYEILSAIHKILANNEEQLLCIGRSGALNVAKENAPLCPISVPKYNEIEPLSISAKRNYILNILLIESNFENCLSLFPESWHILLLTINYYLKKTTVGWYVIYSLIMSKLILTYVDQILGTVYRSSKVFLKKYNSVSVNNKENTFNSNTVKSALGNISKNDCIECLKKLISCFEMDYKMTTNYKSFDRDLVHSISQFQSCLMHIDHLNTLFDFPYDNFYITLCLNCTFVYNFSKNLSKRTNLDEYMNILLKDSPSILYSFNYIVSTLKQYVKSEVCQVVPKRRRKKKKTIKEIYNEQIETVEVNSEGDDVFDPNNKFALLRIQ